MTGDKVDYKTAKLAIDVLRVGVGDSQRALLELIEEYVDQADVYETVTSEFIEQQGKRFRKEGEELADRVDNLKQSIREVESSHEAVQRSEQGQ